MAEFIDETGSKYGRLVVIRRAENGRQGDARWLCKCSCGNERIVLGYSLRDGHTRSCGCLYKEVHLLPKGEAAFNDTYSHMQYGARTRGYKWSLSKEEGWGGVMSHG